MSISERTLYYFTRISQIPRPSGEEEKIADFLTDFAESHHLPFYRDAIGNVYIYKAASPDKAGAEPILLQGHTDMVCEAAPGFDHDFSSLPLSLQQEGERLFARGTTLGADNGVAVALMLALLEDSGLSTPPLECLFTVQEETTMAGAEGCDPARITARRLINLDSEEEDGITVGSAGSHRLTFTLPYEAAPFCNKPLKLRLFGLSGGHSGMEIGTGHSNAILLLGELLSLLYADTPFRLVSMTCDGKANAIPRECTAILSVADPTQGKAAAIAWSNAVRKRLSREDRGFRLHIDSCRRPDAMLPFRDTGRLLSFLSLLPNGVVERLPDTPNTVQTSSNLGILQTGNGVCRGEVMTRFASESDAQALFRRMQRLAKVTGFDLEAGVAHPAWNGADTGTLATAYATAYRAATGGRPIAVQRVHAGLECGILCNRLGISDAISVGPCITGIHTPEECLSLPSLARFCDTIVLLLANL